MEKRQNTHTHTHRCFSSAEGYTERHTAESPHLADWGAASQWPVGILPASFAGRPLAFRSRGRDRRTLCSGADKRNQRKQSFYKSRARVNRQNIHEKTNLPPEHV